MDSFVALASKKLYQGTIIIGNEQRGLKTNLHKQFSTEPTLKITIERSSMVIYQSTTDRNTYYIPSNNNELVVANNGPAPKTTIGVTIVSAYGTLDTVKKGLSIAKEFAEKHGFPIHDDYYEEIELMPSDIGIHQTAKELLRQGSSGNVEQTLEDEKNLTSLQTTSGYGAKILGLNASKSTTKTYTSSSPNPARNDEFTDYLKEMVQKKDQELKRAYEIIIILFLSFIILLFSMHYGKLPIYI